jgi:hypothetical protein
MRGNRWPQRVDLLVDEDPDVHWTVITEVEVAAQHLAGRQRLVVVMVRDRPRVRRVRP